MISEILLPPFPSFEELLYEALRRARWPSGVSCIYCKGRVIKWGNTEGAKDTGARNVEEPGATGLPAP